MGTSLFNGADEGLIAFGLLTSYNVQDLSAVLGLYPENEESLRRVFQAVSDDDQQALEAVGMPGESWDDVLGMLQQLLASGFQLD